MQSMASQTLQDSYVLVTFTRTVRQINFEGGNFCGLDSKTFPGYIFKDYN